jgi:hypothetical protein
MKPVKLAVSLFLSSWPNRRLRRRYPYQEVSLKKNVSLQQKKALFRQVGVFAVLLAMTPEEGYSFFHSCRRSRT